MLKHARRLLEHSQAIPSKTQRERLAAPDRAQPLAPGAIQQRAALAPQSLRPADILRLQQTIGNRAVAQMLSQAAENPTGLPDQLKAGIESLSGISLDNVRVHRNSPKPAEVQALAYAQGTEIHLGPGQEKLLPHEAWHVVQQAQGRVQPTMQMKGVAINDDPTLEREADMMGRRAAATTVVGPSREVPPAGRTVAPRSSFTPAAAQGVFTWKSKKYDENTKEDDWPKNIHGVKPDDVKRLAKNSRDFGVLKTADDVKKAIEKLGVSEKPNLAAEEKANKIKPYLELIDHLAGEEEEGEIKGGHLLKAMQDKWGGRLQYKKLSTKKFGVWESEWTLGKKVGKGKEISKRSTMFPEKWTKDDLQNELLLSTVTSGKLTLPSGIELHKAGDTFYPVV